MLNAMGPNGTGVAAIRHALRLDSGLMRRLLRALEAEGLFVVDAAEEVACHAGLARLVLDTNETLTEALALYWSTGWTETAPYAPPPATHWFAKPL
jgi:hypothetical protein